MSGSFGFRCAWLGSTLRSGSSGSPLRSGSFGSHRARVRSVLLRSGLFGYPLCSGSFGPPRSGSFGSAALGFVWIRAAKTCGRNRRQQLAPTIELASARAERPFAAQHTSSVWEKDLASLHDYRNLARHPAAGGNGALTIRD